MPHSTLAFSGAGGATGGRPSVVIHNASFNGVTDMREFERQITKRSKSRAHTRRGP
jgi:hypothetical protein